MEPNTPWKHKASILASKNIHGVPFNKIKKCLEDFEQNINVYTLVDSTNSQKSLSKVKPGAFIKNYSDYFTKEWSDTTEPHVNENKNTPQMSLKTNQTCFFIEETSSNDTVNSIQSYSHSKSNENESKQVLKSMFTNVSEDIIDEFLLKYNNDLTIVTNILLDSLNLDEKELNQSSDECFCKKESHQTIETVKSVSSLKQLCTDAMNKLTDLFEKYYGLNYSKSIADTIQEENMIEKSIVDKQGMSFVI
jgi:hypothetical protein